MPAKASPPPEQRILTASELDAILDRDDLGSEIVPMPEWGAGVAVRIRGLSMEDVYRARRALADAGLANDDMVGRVRVRDREWLRAAIIEPVLSAEQAERLMSKSADAVLRLIDRINSLNGASQEAGEKLAGEFPAEPQS